MDQQFDPTLLRRLRFTASMAAVLSAAIGLSDLAGWNLDLPVLTNWGVGMWMSPNVAACLVLCCVSLWLRRNQQPTPNGAVRKWASILLAFLSSLIALLSLTERLLRRNFDVDRVLLWGPFARQGRHLMFPLSSIALVALGLALATMDWRTGNDHWPAQFLCSGPALAATFGLIGLGIGPSVSSLSLPAPSIAAFLLLSAGILCSRPHWAIGGLFSRSGPGKKWMRTALAASLLMLTMIGSSISKFLITDEHLTWVEFSLLGVLISSTITGYAAWKAALIDRLDGQRKQAIEVRELLAAVVDCSSDAIITMAPGGKILSWNGGAAQIFGYSAAEALGQSVLMLRAPDRLTIDSELEEQLEDTGARTHFDAVRLRKDGSRVDLSVAISPVRDANGSIFAKSVVARDSTNAKRAERALRESEERFRALANGIPQLAWMAEADGFIYWYNQRWYEYTGTTIEAMRGWGWQSVHDPEVLPMVLQRWKHSIATGTLFDMEYQLRGTKGGWCTFLTRIVPLRNAQGAVVRWFGTHTDISERKQAEDQLAAQAKQLSNQTEELLLSQRALQTQSHLLARQAEELKVSNHELEIFTYSISHDLRAPLRHIAGFSKILMEDFGTEMPSGARDDLERIADAVRRAGQMVDALLNLARLGRQSLKLHPVAMNEMVDQVISILKPEWEERSLEWRIARLPAIACDEALMVHVLQNLLSNAIKYSRGREPAIIEMDCIQNPDKPPIFFVRDNGVGFNMKYAKNLFGMFQRLHTESEFEGTGVGLATAQRILQKHGGSLWAHAEPGRGATFYFNLVANEAVGAPTGIGNDGQDR